jgi:hypothetical protein
MTATTQALATELAHEVGMISPTRELGRWSVSFKFEPRDLWVGVFFKRETKYGLAPALHVYVCPLPTMLFHFVRMDEWRGGR